MVVSSCSRKSGTPEVLGSLGGTSTAGAIVIKGDGGSITKDSGLVITAPIKNGALDTNRALASHNLADLVIDTDAGGANGAFLNIAAAVSGLDIYVGEIGVAKVRLIQRVL
jgi:hypothetical protein